MFSLYSNPLHFRWAEAYMGWGQPSRLRHITSGRYMGVSEDNQIVTYHRTVATEECTAFLVRQSKVKIK